MLINDEGIIPFDIGVLQNISVGGAFVHATKPVEVGLKVELSIKLPLSGKKWLIYSAEVLRVEPGQWGAGTGIAVRFTSLPAFRVM